MQFQYYITPPEKTNTYDLVKQTIYVLWVLISLTKKRTHSQIKEYKNQHDKKQSKSMRKSPSLGWKIDLQLYILVFNQSEWKNKTLLELRSTCGYEQSDVLLQEL